MNDPHVEQAFRLAMQFAVRDDPRRFAEAARKVRTLDRHGEVRGRELDLLALVAALRQGDEGAVAAAEAAVAPMGDADRRRLAELLPRTPEHAVEAFRRRCVGLVEPPRAGVAAISRGGSWIGGGVVAAAVVFVLGAGYFAGGRASLWPLPGWLEAKVERPEDAFRDITIDLLTADLATLWDRLPPSWQEDADNAFVKLVRNVDEDMIRSMRELLEAYAKVFETQGEFIVGSAAFDQVWVSAWSGEIEELGRAFRRLAESPLFDPTSVRSFDTGALLSSIEASGLVRAVVIDAVSRPLAAEMSISAATLRRPDARRLLEGRIGAVVKAEADDYATVELSCGDWERSVEMIREQGRWVSEPMARWWERNLSELRIAAVDLKTLEGQNRTDELLESIAVQRQELDLLSTATTQREFDEILAGMPARMFVRLNLW